MRPFHSLLERRTGALRGTPMGSTVRVPVLLLSIAVLVVEMPRSAPVPLPIKRCPGVHPFHSLLERRTGALRGNERVHSGACFGNARPTASKNGCSPGHTYGWSRYDLPGKPYTVVAAGAQGAGMMEDNNSIHILTAPTNYTPAAAAPGGQREPSIYT